MFALAHPDWWLMFKKQAQDTLLASSTFEAFLGCRERRNNALLASCQNQPGTPLGAHGVKTLWMDSLEFGCWLLCALKVMDKPAVKLN